MKLIEIITTKGLKTNALISDEDLNMLCQFKWYLDSKGYAYMTKRMGKGIRKTTRMHRLIMNAPKNMCVDHINGNTLDNRRENLRLCSNAENSKNLKLAKNNKSGFRGVSWFSKSGKWRAVITCDGKYQHLGLFESKNQAIEAYVQKAKELYGEFYQALQLI